MGNTLKRYNSVRRADDVNDQLGSAAIENALGAQTQEQLQTFFLSRLKQIIFGETATENWFDDMFGAGIRSLRELTEHGGTGGGSRVLPLRQGVQLIGFQDGVNRIFRTPEYFVHTSNGMTIEVWHNGRRLAQSVDYTVSESGGVDTGFDTVELSFSPSDASLLANYAPASEWAQPDIDIRQGVQLVGIQDGVNRVFRSPEYFAHKNGERTIEVWHNGRRLAQSQVSDPRSGDYMVAESRGPGTGFDTINLLSFAPVSTSTLLANYTLGRN